jgi:hypothetical protein
LKFKKLVKAFIFVLYPTFYNFWKINYWLPKRRHGQGTAKRELQQTQFKFQFQQETSKSSFVPGIVGPREIATNPIQVPVSVRDKQVQFCTRNGRAKRDCNKPNSSSSFSEETSKSSFVPGMVGSREIATNPIQVPVSAKRQTVQFCTRNGRACSVRNVASLVGQVVMPPCGNWFETGPPSRGHSIQEPFC